MGKLIPQLLCDFCELTLRSALEIFNIQQFVQSFGTSEHDKDSYALMMKLLAPSAESISVVRVLSSNVSKPICHWMLTWDDL